MAKNDRKMTKAEVDQYLANMNNEINALLNAIRKAVPPKYQLTLVARHPEMPEAQMIWTTDTDLEAVADALLDKKAKVVGGKKDEPAN